MYDLLLHSIIEKTFFYSIFRYHTNYELFILSSRSSFNISSSYSQKSAQKQWVKRRFTKKSLQEGILICRDCHDALHKMISRKECATTYNTCEKILHHPDFSNFVRWVKTQNKFRFKQVSKRRKK